MAPAPASAAQIALAHDARYVERVLAGRLEPERLAGHHAILFEEAARAAA